MIKHFSNNSNTIVNNISTKLNDFEDTLRNLTNNISKTCEEKLNDKKNIS